MNPILRSPFGPAAEQHCNIKAHAELALLDENVKNLSKTLVEEYKKETAKYQHLAEMERDARREAEARARSYAKVINQHDDLKAKLESMIPDLMQEVQHLPKGPEVAELEAQLRAAEKERGSLAELLRAAEEERDAALRARDTALARLRPRQEDGIVVGDAEALQVRLDAPTLCGVLASRCSQIPSAREAAISTERRAARCASRTACEPRTLAWGFHERAGAARDQTGGEYF